MSNYYYGLLGVFKRRIPLVTFFGKSGTLLVVTAIFSSHGEHQLYEIRYIPHSDERNEIENDERYGSTTSDDGDKPKKSSRGEPRSNQNPTHNQIRTTHTVLYLRSQANITQSDPGIAFSFYPSLQYLQETTSNKPHIAPHLQFDLPFPILPECGPSRRKSPEMEPDPFTRIGGGTPNAAREAF